MCSGLELIGVGLIAVLLEHNIKKAPLDEVEVRQYVRKAEILANISQGKSLPEDPFHWKAYLAYHLQS